MTDRKEAITLAYGCDRGIDRDRCVLCRNLLAMAAELAECEQVLTRITKHGALQGLNDCYELLAKLKEARG